MAESFSRLKLRQAPQKEGGEILCGPGWCVHKSDVQNKLDDSITHTQAGVGTSAVSNRGGTLTP